MITPTINIYTLLLTLGYSMIPFTTCVLGSLISLKFKKPSPIISIVSQHFAAGIVMGVCGMLLMPYLSNSDTNIYSVCIGFILGTIIFLLI